MITLADNEFVYALHYFLFQLFILSQTEVSRFQLSNWFVYLLVNFALFRKYFRNHATALWWKVIFRIFRDFPFEQNYFRKCNLIVYKITFQLLRRRGFFHASKHMLLYLLSQVKFL